MSLVDPNDHYTLLAVIIGLAWIGFWAERTRLGKVTTGIVWTGGLAIVLSNLGVIPQAAPVYDVIPSILVPLAIPLFLMQVNLRQIVSQTGWIAMAFLLGAVGTIIGAIAGAYFLELGALEPELAGIFAATYIGGTINFVSTVETLAVSDGALVSAALAADSIVGKVYLLLLALIPSLSFVQRLYGAGRHAGPVVSTEGSSSAAQLPELEKVTENDATERPAGLNMYHLVTVLFLSSVICAAGYTFASIIGADGYGILFVSLFALLPGTLFPRWTASLTGPFELGLVFAFLFFASVGATANIATLIGIAPTVIVFAIIIVVIHAAVIFPVGRLLGLSLEDIITASNACILGPTTAAALAAARGWKAQVTRD